MEATSAILRRFDKRFDNTQFDGSISAVFGKTRWLLIKRIYKLCNNLEAAKPTEDDYDPCYKFKMIYKTIVHNTNAITKKAGLDLCGDETSWPFGGFAEAKSGIVSTIIGKHLGAIEVDKLLLSVMLTEFVLVLTFIATRSTPILSLKRDQVKSG